MKRNLFISIFVCLFAKAFAFDFSAECPSGQTLYYEIISSDDATVRVTYAKEDFANDTYYSGFVEPAGNLEIPSVVEYYGIDYHVVEIGQKAFRFCNGLIGVIIPDGIVTICENAFDNDRSLATVVFGEGLVEIETSAFSQCSNLSGELHFPSSLRKIGDFAFNRCSGLNGSLVFNEGLETIGRYTFQLCDNITSLTIPKSLKELGYVSFNMCDNLKTCYFNAVSCRTSHSFDEDFDLFVIGENVQSITGDNMCSSASVYTFRFLASNVSSINLEFTSVYEIEIGNHVRNLPEGVFAGCYGMKEITIPSSVKTIGKSAFAACPNLKYVVIPNGVQNIGVGAFASCHSLSDVVVGNGVSTIPSGMFSDCDELKSVTFGRTVRTISSNAFDGCEKLQSVTLLSRQPPVLSSEAFDYYTAKIIVPCGCKETYKQTEGWNWFESISEGPQVLWAFIPSNGAFGSVQIEDYPDCEDDKAIVCACPAPGKEFVCWFLDGEVYSREPRIQVEVSRDMIMLAYFNFGIGVSEKPDEVVELYPNPVDDFLYIKSPDGDDCLETSLYDVFGRLVGKKPAGVSGMNVSGLPSGMYLLQIKKDDTAVSLQKVIVSH